jgi:CspA family cold shock protein
MALEGTVIFFSAKKGFGFIAQKYGQPDLFCHWTSIRGMEGYKELKTDQRVSYILGTGPSGRVQADEVFVLEDY